MNVLRKQERSRLLSAPKYAADRNDELGLATGRRAMERARS
jgi:hypothetical protein